MNKNHIIDGRQIAEAIKDEITLNIFKDLPRRPSLAIILVGQRPDSEIYVALKEREAKKVGIDTHLYRLEESSSEEDLLGVINFLNNDPEVDAILLQLPLPDKFKADQMIAAINPSKDADGFHPEHPDYILSPVIAAVDFIIHDYKVGGRACVFYRSEVFGQSLRKHLENHDLLVDLLPVAETDDPRHNQNLQQSFSEVSRRADMVITALGLPEFLNQTYLKTGAVIVDVGITKVGDRVVGDVDFADVLPVASAITPVPGGIGPMTIAFLFKNVWEIYRRR